MSILIKILIFYIIVFTLEFNSKLLIIPTLVKSSFHINGESMTFLSGDLTEKISPNTKIIVINIIVITNLSEILFICLIYLEKFFSGVVFSYISRKYNLK